MIIHSTTLNTEDKVKAIYGSNTSWIQHSGYVLRGATSGVTANSATKTGGNDNMIVPYHTHNIRTQYGALPSASAQFTPATGDYCQMSNSAAYISGKINYAGTNGNTTNANIPNYKSVYIWERTA